ncbi:MAG: hypothetical protein IKB99_04235, partial [Lentisphaeria bacterium]|nr:hypothetical protein [Lentisphaeria bacterium]
SSIKVKGAGEGREPFLKKGSPFLPRTPSILAKNFWWIAVFASAKPAIPHFEELQRQVSRQEAIFRKI